MSCLHCLALAEQLADLRFELQQQQERWNSNADLLAKRYRLSLHQSIILNQIYRANGRILSTDQLDEMLPESHDGLPRTRNHITVVLHHIRARLGGGVIFKNHWGQGWSITDLGRLLCDEALEARARAA